MELDLLSLFVLHVHSCTHWLRPRNLPPPHLGSYIRGRYWSAKIDVISLCSPGSTLYMLGWTGGGGGLDIKFTTYTHAHVCRTIPYHREYWKIYRGPGFSRHLMIWLLPHPLPNQQVVSLSQSFCVSPVQAYWRERGESWVGEGASSSSYDSEKAWSSVTH